MDFVQSSEYAPSGYWPDGYWQTLGAVSPFEAATADATYTPHRLSRLYTPDAQSREYQPARQSRLYTPEAQSFTYKPRRKSREYTP